MIITCESCGMPMTKENHHGGKDMGNKYCVYCCDEKGHLKPFEIKLNEMTGFIIKTRNLNQKEAEKLANETMRKMPAWKDYYK